MVARDRVAGCGGLRKRNGEKGENGYRAPEPASVFKGACLLSFFSSLFLSSFAVGL